MTIISNHKIDLHLNIFWSSLNVEKILEGQKFVKTGRGGLWVERSLHKRRDSVPAVRIPQMNVDE